MSTLVSIDWDFFIPHGMYKPEVYLPNVKDTMPGLLVFDWQMSEARHPALEDAVWRNRAANFKRWGLDIVEETKLPLSVDDFMTELSFKLNDAVLPAWKADSHAWAAIVARDFHNQYGPLSVVNFDAHHDLGYENLDPEKLACDNWVLVGLENGHIQDYTLVYPDWLGKAEWRGVKRPHLKRFSKRIRVTTWSEWAKADGILDDPQAAFVCRSSSWTPPWLDQGFQDLGDEWGWTECLDCNHGKHNTAYDVCENREWDWAEIWAEEKVRAEAFEALKKISS